MTASGDRLLRLASEQRMQAYAILYIDPEGELHLSGSAAGRLFLTEHTVHEAVARLKKRRPELEDITILPLEYGP